MLLPADPPDLVCHYSVRSTDYASSIGPGVWLSRAVGTQASAGWPVRIRGGDLQIHQELSYSAPRQRKRKRKRKKEKGNREDAIYYRSTDITSSVLFWRTCSTLLSPLRAVRHPSAAFRGRQHSILRTAVTLSGFRHASAGKPNANPSSLTRRSISVLIGKTPPPTPQKPQQKPEPFQ